MLLQHILAFTALYSESEGGGGNPLLSVDPGLAIWTGLIFIALLILLRLFAWKPILGALDQREKSIRESLESAEKAKEEAERMIAENKKSMAKAEDEARKMLDENKKYAEELKNNMLNESKEQAKKIIDDANKEIERKKQEAFREIKDQVASISLEIAEKLIKKNLDKNAHRDIITDHLDELRKN